MQTFDKIPICVRKVGAEWVCEVGLVTGKKEGRIKLAKK
jgi:hypothetical protein